MPDPASSAVGALLEQLIAKHVAAEVARRLSVPPEAEDWLTPVQAAAILKIKLNTLQHWRWAGTKGPPFTKLGRNVVRYKRADVLGFMEGRVRRKK